MTRSSSMTSRSVLRCLAPRLPALSIDFGSVFCSMPLGRIAGRPVTPLSLAISARSSATACFSAAFSASRRSVSASRSPRDSSERGIFSGTDMPGTNRVRKERMQPHSASYLPGLLPQVRVKLGRNKTDRADAALICDYCRLFEPAAWTPPSAALRELRDLVRTREALKASRVEWTSRRGSGQGSTAADAAMAGVIARLEAEFAALDQAIVHVIGQDEDLQARHDLLISVPGIATHTAAVILSELLGPAVLRTAREAAAYAGLNPSHRQSGSSLDAPSRISRIGNATLRAALYLPALAAIRWNPLVAALRQRLKDQGRLKPKQIVAAAMRKLLHLCFGVLKTGKPFDPEHTTSTEEAASTV